MQPLLLAALVAVLSMIVGIATINHLARRQLRQHPGVKQVGFIDLGSITGSLSSIIKVVAVLTVIGATIGLLFTSIADIVNEFTTGTTNSTTADLLLPVLGMIVALAGVFLIVRKVFEATK